MMWEAIAAVRALLGGTAALLSQAEPFFKNAFEKEDSNSTDNKEEIGVMRNLTPEMSENRSCMI